MGPTLSHTAVPAQAEKGLGSLENELLSSEAQKEKVQGWHQLDQAGQAGPSSLRPHAAHEPQKCPDLQLLGWAGGGSERVILSGPSQG